MKVKIILVLLTVIFQIFCSNETPNPACEEFQQGEFLYNDQLFGEYIVSRTKDKQIEYNAKTELKVEFGVKWKNDCTYELRFNKILSNPAKLSLPTDLSQMVKTCKITKIEEDSYTEEASSNLNDMIHKTIFKKN